ncbi:uncharacterized protein C5L36_0A03720 [Pichia kudriavzevii]|uniref:Transcriptional regulator CRZ1 n=2 Tax=Pichia kudriavzevii TaxID=4909 RepID=A0A1V2LSS7_PICKU|nr:uncharacterized protein C5L36_0A03720 [Pichia kudriavzevii]AWU73772.1 hypothetical protein C5L36_0A03720 [Pichia kudriavzevii]ONH76734.1 Transcriptional regulator CRZ1 [Pichia kudriavzevii]
MYLHHINYFHNNYNSYQPLPTPMYSVPPTPLSLKDEVKQSHFSQPFQCQHPCQEGPDQNVRPFYLYKGLDPQREEQFKIYPVSNGPNAVLGANVNRSDAVMAAAAPPSPSTSTSSESDDESSVLDNELIKEIKDSATDKLKYKCNYPGCRYKGTFLSKDYIRRHIREQHKREREHVCQGFHSNGEMWGCNKRFSRPYQLINHWRGQRSLKRCGVPESELRRCGVL